MIFAANERLLGCWFLVAVVVHLERDDLSNQEPATQ
jgi:hypothetical protein